MIPLPNLQGESAGDFSFQTAEILERRTFKCMVLAPVSPALGKLRQEEHGGFEAQELPSETLSSKKTKTNLLPQFKSVCTESSLSSKVKTD